jgi:hypothetical protein
MSAASGTPTGGSLRITIAPYWNERLPRALPFAKDVTANYGKSLNKSAKPANLKVFGS